MNAQNKQICSKCKTIKDIDDFSYRNKVKGIREKRCKVCKDEYRKIHYENNKEIYKKRAKDYTTKIRAVNSKKMCDYLRRHPCVDCTESDIRVLHFDHVRGVKIDEVTSMVHAGCSWKKILNEIAKCEVRCANCHIKRTSASRGWKYRKL